MDQSWEATMTNAEAREAAMYTALVHLVTTVVKERVAVFSHSDVLMHFFG